ncbi:polyketide cyclase [Dokdonella soli]|uniref:SRPBCC family protein n=1 Tax=Dokdonella soli TaxID=529810 RepID=A0ABP3TYR7_9GAMM
MIRIVEVLVALLIVFLLAVVVGVMLPDHGHIERTVEVSSPVRQVYDSINTFRRYPQWSALRSFDPRIQMTLEGPESGPRAKVSWTSAVQKIGTGSLEIKSNEPDSKVNIAIDNNWTGNNKNYTVSLQPSSSGKTLKIYVAYDVDYGWNLMWRYAGLYINGDPATVIQTSLNNLSAMLAGFPNTDYKDQQIAITDLAAKPVFLVNTKAKRTLEDVAEATSTAMTAIDAAMKKAGLTAVGPRMTITTNWGEEDYTFSVAVPVSAASVTIAGQQHAIETPVLSPSDTGGDEEEQPKTFNPGDKDKSGMLVIDANVRAALWSQGKALVTEYTGSPAALPLMRLNQKAYAETHGYHYNEQGVGRFWDELTSAPDAAQDQQTFKVYLPIQL